MMKGLQHNAPLTSLPLTLAYQKENTQLGIHYALLATNADHQYISHSAI